MKPLDIIILIVIAMLVIAAIRTYKKKGGCSCSAKGCCNDCTQCQSGCKNSIQ